MMTSVQLIWLLTKVCTMQGVMTSIFILLYLKSPCCPEVLCTLFGWEALESCIVSVTMSSQTCELKECLDFAQLVVFDLWPSH